MPWSASEAKSHTKKADNPSKAAKWAKIANAALATYKKKGLSQSEAEGRAIATANSAMDSKYWSGRTFDSDAFHIALNRPRLKAKDRRRRDPDEDDGEEDDDPDDDEDDDDDMDDHASVLRDNGTVEMGETEVVFSDKIDIKDARVSYRDGMLIAMPRTARAGVQLYTGDECGMPNMPFVRVFRPPEEVFDKAALKSYTHRTVTLDHPPEDVTPENWKKYSSGWTGDEILRDGDTFRVPMMLADAAAITSYKDHGISELSWGYSCLLDWTPGVVPKGVQDEGQEYDAVQRRFRANHLAVVPSARGGSALRIGDAAGDIENDDASAFHDDREGGSHMAPTVSMRSVNLDGIDLQLDPQTASIVMRCVQGLEKQIKDAKKDLKEKEDDDEEKAADAAKVVAKVGELEGELKKRDATIEDLNKQLKIAKDAAMPAALDARVRDRLAVIKKARHFLGDKLIIDGKTTEEMRKQVVDSKLGAVAATFTDQQHQSAFEALEVKTPDGRFGRQNPIDQARDAFMTGGDNGGYETSQQARDKAHSEYERDLTNAWQHPAGTPQPRQ